MALPKDDMKDQNLDSLSVLLQQAESARDAAELELRRALATVQAAQGQLHELITYRAEYERRYAAQFARGASGIDIVRCYQGFMQRLAQAIAQQTRVVEHGQARLEATREPLRRHELQVASIRKLIERRIEERRREAQQRERRLSDEAAARSSSAQRPGLFGGSALLRGV
jgi:flagellar protein FliJ